MNAKELADLLNKEQVARFEVNSIDRDEYGNDIEIKLYVFNVYQATGRVKSNNFTEDSYLSMKRMLLENFKIDEY